LLFGIFLKITKGRLVTTELDKAIHVIASRTTREEFKNIKSVMYGLFCGASFGFDESGLAFRVHLDQQYKNADKKRLYTRGLRVVK
jgi:hypothetical protein